MSEKLSSVNIGNLDDVNVLLDETKLEEQKTAKNYTFAEMLEYLWNNDDELVKDSH